MLFIQTYCDFPKDIASNLEWFGQIQWVLNHSQHDKTPTMCTIHPLGVQYITYQFKRKTNKVIIKWHRVFFTIN